MSQFVSRTNLPEATPAVDLAKIFNTAVVASHTQVERELSNELAEAIRTPAYQALLGAITELAAKTGVSEREAAEQLVQTFRKVDSIWSHYVFQEGIERLKR